MIKRIIFDLDNTLIMSNSFLEPNKRALERCNIYDIEKAKLLDYCGDTYETIYTNYNRKDFLEFINHRTGLALKDEFLDILFEELGKCAPADFEIEKQILKYLSKKYELVILTNYFKVVQEQRLKTAGVLDLFLEVTGENHPKPQKEAYLKACGIHKPEECIMIGDNFAYDVKTPREFGLNSIWITQKQPSNGNDIINSLSELKDIL